ncbi:IS66 family transposase [Ralstonia sp.]|uniref:IS66 family transposase n=1 Tax=Ralstonia sp. TaxID=54061 RepID=UPI00397B23F1
MNMSCDARHDALPDDVATLKAMVAQRDAQLSEQQSTIAQLKRTNDGLTHRMELLLRRLYGRSSERVEPAQLLLFGQAVAGQAAQADKPTDENASAPPPSRQRNGRGHGRRPLPEDLPRHRIEHPLDAAERVCPCCGEARQRIGEWISEQLEYTPASFFVLQHVRGKYACKHCEEGGVATAEKADDCGGVIEQGLPGPGLVAHVITSKYCDHLPLYRQEQMYTRHGARIARSTMCGWLKEAAKLIEPLHGLMCERIRQSKVIHTDDTPLPVQQKGRGKTKTGRLWVYLGDARNPYTIYEYTPTRERDGPMNWLKDFTGYLQADAFGGYDGIYASGDVLEVACWAHARRKAYDARLSDPARAHHALSMIRQLYDIEAQAASMDATERHALREREAAGVLDALEAWLKQEQDAVLPKAPMGQAIQYALNHWEALRRYVTDGDLAIDNNRAERAIRPLAIGRKNYLFAGNDGGGRTAAILYSLIASAKRHELDPFAYLRDVLARIGSTPLSELEQFLPDRWKAQLSSTSSHDT